jgi:hypothetical protein
MTPGGIFPKDKLLPRSGEMWGRENQGKYGENHLSQPLEYFVPFSWGTYGRLTGIQTKHQDPPIRPCFGHGIPE